MAATHNIEASRVSEVIEMTGLAGVATKRVAGFSLGMGQRLGIAAALLGDPRTLILDEPVNGLDPEGVQWVRQLVRALAAEGRTVFLSSHLMSEMSQTADHLLVIGRGHIIAAGPVQQVIDSVAGGAVRVRSPRAGDLAAALAADGATVTSPEAGMLEVSGTTAEHVGEVAFRNGLLLHELSPRRASLEEAYMSLTQDAVEYRAHTTPPLPGPRRPRTNEHPDRRPPDDLTRRHPARRRAGAAHLRGGRARGVDQAAVPALDVVGAGLHRRSDHAGGPGRRRVPERHGRRPRPGPGHRADAPGDLPDEVPLRPGERQCHIPPPPGMLTGTAARFRHDYRVSHPAAAENPEPITPCDCPGTERLTT